MYNIAKGSEINPMEVELLNGRTVEFSNERQLRLKYKCSQIELMNRKLMKFRSISFMFKNVFCPLLLLTLDIHFARPIHGCSAMSVCARFSLFTLYADESRRKCGNSPALYIFGDGAPRTMAGKSVKQPDPMKLTQR